VIFSHFLFQIDLLITFASESCACLLASRLPASEQASKQQNAVMSSLEKHQHGKLSSETDEHCE